ncbi:hypothetical protein HUU40_00365 [candidate division KSB1 bacterium]|nr:hypothetical protein [candidate division KSB1 bacterium]
MTGISLTFGNLSAAMAIALINTASTSGGAASAVVVSNSDDDDSGPVNTNAPALDATGLPWDERIHAKTKTQTAAGAWKKGKGVTAEMTAAVEAELRAKMASPVPQPNFGQQQPGPFVPPVQNAAPSYGFANPTAVPNQAVPVAHMPEMQQQPAPIVQQPAAIQQPQQPSAIDFNGLMVLFQKAMAANRMQVTDVAAYVGEINSAWHTNFGQITEISARPEICNWVVQLLQRDNRYIAG